MKRYILLLLMILMLISSTTAQPQLDITPSPVKFGYISAYGEHQSELVIHNVGDQDAIISGCDHLEDFNIELPENLTIPPGESATVTAVFTPYSESNYDSYFLFYYNNTGEPVYELPVLAQGIKGFQPGEIIWSFQHIENVVCVTATEDYNGDGLPDVAAEGFDAIAGDGDPLVCLSGSGIDIPQTIWSVCPQGGPSNSGGYGDDCLTYCGDLNGDGHGDLLRGGAWGSRTVFAIDGITGETIWSYDTYEHTPTGWIYSVAQTSDLNDDGIGEVLAAVGSDANRVYCLDGANGDLIWRYIAADVVYSVKSLADVDDDGYSEAVFGAGDNGTKVYCISGYSSDVLGDPIWIYNTGANVFNICTIGDINDDSYQDVIAGTWGGGVIALSGYSESDEGSHLWTYTPGNNIMRVTSCPDLNDDGYEDVLVASWGSYAEAVSGFDGSSLWRTYCGDNVWAIDYTGDINGDGVVEAVAGSFTKNVYLMDGVSGDILWQTDVGAKPFTLRGIGDVNGDGYADVICGTQMLNEQGGQVFILSGWRSAQVDIADRGVPTPTDISLAINYPNPFNSSTIIKFNLAQAESYSISIYDIAGRLVDMISGDGAIGRNTVEWHTKGDDMATGVYFYRIATASQAIAGKMTYLK